MVVSSQARKMARKMISERGKLLLGASLIQIVVAVVIILFPFLGNTNKLILTPMLISLLITFITIPLVPLVLGLLHINNKVYYGRGGSVGNLFDFFRSWRITLRVIGVRLVLTVILFVALVPVMIVTMILFMTVTFSLGALSANLIFLLAILVFSAISIAIGSIQMASCFIALRYPEISFGKLFGGSFKVGGRYMWRYICLSFSFTGWGLLGSLLLIIPLAIAMPSILNGLMTGTPGILFVGAALFSLYLIFLSVYIKAATTVFFNCAIDEYEQKSPKNGGFEPREERGETEEERD